MKIHNKNVFEKYLIMVRTSFFAMCVFYFVGYSQDVLAVPSIVDDSVYATAVQADGKMLIGGDFTTYNGTPINRIARLNVDGTLDTGFDPGQGVDGEVRDIEVLSDGKILVSGGFTEYDETLSFYIVRLNADGS